MKRKISLLISILLLAALIQPVSITAADTNAGSISGSTASYYDGMVVSTFSFRSDDANDTKGLIAITGTITYSTADLKVINKTVLANGWTVTFTEKKAGTITFSAKTADNSLCLKAAAELFKINFAVITSSSSAVTIAAKSLKATRLYTHTVVDAYDPGTGEATESHTEDTTDSVSLSNLSQKVKTVSADSYLSSAGFEDATLSPAFTKKNNSYTVTTTTSNNDLKALMVAESPDAVVSVGEEINSQILVTVTAADGKTTNTYLFTIQRTADGSSDSPSNSDTPSTEVTATKGFSATAIILLSVAGLAGAAALAFGFIFLDKGSHE